MNKQVTASVQSNQPLNLRAHLIELLSKVTQGQSLAQELHPALRRVAAHDRALFHELSLGTLRQWLVLKQIAAQLISRGRLPELASVEIALYVGLYQLLFTRIAAHAAIFETVTAIKQLGYTHAASFVNAVLRRAHRECETLTQQTHHMHGLPSWLYKQLKKDWGEQDAFSIAATLRGSAPLYLRVNTRLITRDQYLQQLHDCQIKAQPSSTEGIRLLQSVSIPDLPGYALGWFSVQDQHAQLALDFVPNLDGCRVLDACAAPGGKTAHLLERFKPKQLIALDIDSHRLQRIHENLTRLQLLPAPDSTEAALPRVDLVQADAATWCDRQLFDFILLDAPCSATGVLRRHPDIRLLRQSTDIEQTVQLQRSILNHAWIQLHPGGHLLYVTCSILKRENEQQMQHFLACHLDAQATPLSLPPHASNQAAIPQSYGIQLLPAPDSGDGFYYCLLFKRPDAE